MFLIYQVSYTNETKWDTEHKDRFDEAIEAGKNADYIILCLGENSYCEKPGDLNDLYLHELQTELAQEMLKLNKKVILVLSEGRPRLISKFSANVDVIVQTYLPGIYGANALTNILAGEVNPSGKLPYTYPAFPNSLVPYYHKYAEEQSNTDSAYNYQGDYNYEYPFGHGLSYTTFSYSNVRINKTELPSNSNENIIVSVDVTNTGSRAGKEVVQLYSADLYALLPPDVKRLRRFAKISLNPRETKTVSFTLKVKDLSFVNLENKRVVESGDFEFQIGSSSAKIEGNVSFTLK